MTIKVLLPPPLRSMAHVAGEVSVEVQTLP